MPSRPLLSHGSPQAVVAYRDGVAVTARQFLRDASLLSRRLPRSRHVLNVCADRYRFAVGLAACLISQRVSLLPPTHTPQVIAQLKAFAPDACVLADDSRCDIDLPQVIFAGSDSSAGDSSAGDSPRAMPAFAIPEIPASQLAAIVFTSGSTGMPVPHRKTWGRLVDCVRSGAALLGLGDAGGGDGETRTLIATVPGQHMYGLESTVLLAWQSGNAFSAGRPLYPADVAAAIGMVPQPRILVTTPVHLRTLLASELKLPPLECVICATAPLSQELARTVEAQFATTLSEIYGSTESGQIALRRTARSAVWQLWPGVRLSAANGQVYAQGGHLEQRTPLCDVIEITGEHEFLLHGRTADMVEIAGKRSSFGYLNAQLTAIPGVVDGAFFLRQEPAGATGVARLGAVVAAPTLSAAALTEQLRRRIDAVFMPRSLLMVDELPRNATGKLPREALQAFTDASQGSPELQ